MSTVLTNDEIEALINATPKTKRRYRDRYKETHVQQYPAFGVSKTLTQWAYLLGVKTHRLLTRWEGVKKRYPHSSPTHIMEGVICRTIRNKGREPSNLPSDPYGRFGGKTLREWATHLGIPAEKLYVGRCW